MRYCQKLLANVLFTQTEEKHGLGPQNKTEFHRQRVIAGLALAWHICCLWQPPRCGAAWGQRPAVATSCLLGSMHDSMLGVKIW